MKMSQVVHVLVVDDSAYVRKVFKQMLSRSPFIEVVGTARDGIEALEMVEQLNPDVVTLDLIMPRMNGIEFITEQMARRPVPVIVVSIASEGGAMTLAALDAGAIDFIQKPTALATEKIFEIGEELIAKVKAAAGASLSSSLGLKLREKAVPPARLTAERAGLVDVVVIGISTGGPQALKRLIPQFPSEFPVPVATVLHMPAGYTEMYAEKLDEISPLKVIEAREGDSVEAGTVLIAPGGRHLSFRRRADGSVVAHIDARPFDTLHRPSVDVLFQSAADIYRTRVLGVVMTGMGHDGREGSAWIKAQGGLVFAESEESCVVYGMPRSVIEAGLSDRIVPLDRMAQAIMEVV
jgi:two-component system, chemotaxis family, protein-glutamate methylesterase/glutaminase